MKKFIPFICVLLLFAAYPLHVSAQIPQEAQQKMQQQVTNLKKQIADLEKDIVKAKTEDPESVSKKESKLQSLKQQLSMIEGASKMMGGIPNAVLSEAKKNNNPSDDGLFPSPKTALLNALPKKNLTKPELITFLTGIHNELKKKTSPEIVQAAQAIITEYGNDYAKVAMNGVAAWYNTAPSESLLILTYAASKSPTDNILNNCGAVLNLYGMEEKAIPVLRYVLPRHRENCTLLNNIGQAFAGLGATDSAMAYFSRVLNRCSTHPDANATAAYIAHANGNDAAAAQYMENSLTGAFSQQRLNFLKKIKPDAKPLVDPDKVNPTEKYFEPNGFGPAPNVRSWDDCELVDKKQKAVFGLIDQLSAKYSNIIIANSLTKILEDPQEKLNWENRKGWKQGPFSQKASYLIEQLGNLYIGARQEYVFALFAKMKVFTDQRYADRLAIDADYNAQYKACGPNPPCVDKVNYNHCLALKNHDNVTFLGRTKISEEFERDCYEKDVNYYNDLIFLLTLKEPHPRTRLASWATQTRGLLSNIRAFTLSICIPSSKPNCQPPGPAPDPTVNDPFFKDGKCVIDVKIPFVVGSLSLNCESFSIEGGEGVTFRYDKNFKSKETTLAIGVGVNADIPGLDLSAGAELGVKFDANNQPIDLIGSTQAGIGITGMSSPLVAVGASVGINSSFTPSFTAFGK